ncbi:MAG: RnfH family protein, partial [Rhodanobacteraceae bacterium]
MPESLTVEVVCALPQRAFVRQLELPAGSTVQDAINASSVRAACPELNDVPLRVGIFSKSVKLDQVLHDGDRVELYRPLR